MKKLSVLILLLLIGAMVTAGCTAFEGTHAECEQWLHDHCYQDVELMGDTNWVNNDPACVNGNGFAWKYFIQVSFEK